MLPLILLVPLAAAMVVISFMRSSMKIRYIALAASLISLVLLPLVSYGAVEIPWFSVGGFQASILTSIAPVNMLLLGIVLFIGVLIFFYSGGFMEKPSEQKRFYLEMLAFEASMLAFAMAGNFILFFIAWEFLSLTSYLLIGFWYKERPAAAARKAITIIVIGDIALLAAIVLIYTQAQTLVFSSLISSSQHLLVTRISMLLLILAIMTKSAQVPFQEWLPDAMEGPTPVSAFLHSTTMVKAGVFAAIVLSPLLIDTHTISLLIPIGVVTAVLAMFNAMREFQVKRIIAYSTMQELGLMLAAVGTGAISAAIYFFFAQAFYKALLFFNAGSAMKSTGEEDIREMSGLTQSRLILITTLFGVFSVVGFIPFDGFFANTALAGAFSGNIIVYAVLTLISLGSSFYIFRWLIYLSKPSKSPSVRLGYKGQPRSMVYSAVILAPLTLLASLGYKYLPILFQNSYTIIPYTPFTIALPDAAIETVAAVAGAIVAYLVYKKAYGNPLPKPVNAVVYTSRIFNALYRYSALFVTGLADGVATFDTYLSDIFDFVGRETVAAGMGARHAATGRINQYALVIVVALVIISAYLFLKVQIT